MIQGSLHNATSHNLQIYLVSFRTPWFCRQWTQILCGYLFLFFGEILMREQWSFLSFDCLISWVPKSSISDIEESKDCRLEGIGGGGAIGFRYSDIQGFLLPISDILLIFFRKSDNATLSSDLRFFTNSSPSFRYCKISVH